ncbi:hypothetical protein EDC04DRAFT_1873806 [Pisolithus marmoratus]|nr:hypothetical protein EDC04DRAFT_1873806 [Pisolithus marmoratus]
MELGGENKSEKLLIMEGSIATDLTMEDLDCREDVEVMLEGADGSRSLEADDNRPLSKSLRTAVTNSGVASEVPPQSASRRDIGEAVQVSTPSSQQPVMEPNVATNEDLRALHSRMEGITNERETETHSFFGALTGEGPCALGDEGINANEQPPIPIDTESVSVVERSLVGSSTSHALSVVPIVLQQPFASEEDLSGLTGKRSVPSAPSDRPAKRPRTDSGSKARSGINLSALRRENELYRVIEELGGIANLHTKEIYGAHTTLLDTMTRDKEPTSAPAGTRLDKRTAESTLRSLESQGRIKMLRTSLILASGTSKPACLLYLPDTPQERINSYLRGISRSTPSTSAPLPIKTLGEPVEFGAAGRRGSQRPSCSAEPIRDKVEAPGDQSSTLNLQASISSSPSGRRRRRTDLKEVTGVETGAVLLRPAEGARHQRVAELAARIRAIRTQFMQSTLTEDLEHWEGKIRAAIVENEQTRKEPIAGPKQLPTDYSRPVGPPPLVANPPEKTVMSLIAEQGPPIVQPTSSGGKGKDKQREGNLPCCPCGTIYIQ